MPQLSLTMVDSYNRTTKKLIEVETQADLATYLGLAQGIVDDLEEITDLGVSRVDLILDAAGTGFAATAGSNIDTGGTVQGYVASGNGKKASTKIPGIKPALVDADGDLILTDQGLEAYLQNFETAGACRLSDGETISTWIGGHLDK